MQALFSLAIPAFLILFLTGCEATMPHTQTDFAFDHLSSDHSSGKASGKSRWVKSVGGVQLHRLNPDLTRDLVRIARYFNKPVYVVSGCRSVAHNRAVGGMKGSYHTRCLAADFFIPGVSKRKIARYANSLSDRGGIGLYCNKGSVHLDVGPKREWYWGCRKKKPPLIAKRKNNKAPEQKTAAISAIKPTLSALAVPTAVETGNGLGLTDTTN